MAEAKKKHLVLVHGASHGAWCWYKVKPLLELVGHRVTLLDLAASGINRKSMENIYSFREYTEPLLKFLADLDEDEKVILVGHSLGGMNLAFATQEFPHKISLAVYLTAFMPDTLNKPSYVIDKFNERTPPEEWLDTTFGFSGNSEASPMTMFFGIKFLSSKLYDLSPIEDLELAKALTRPSSFFLKDFAKANTFTNEGYGSITRVFVICNEDKIITEEFQRWMIDNSGAEQVMEIDGSDHMPMFSKPQQLCHCLSQIIDNHYHLRSLEIKPSYN